MRGTLFAVSLVAACNPPAKPSEPRAPPAPIVATSASSAELVEPAPIADRVEPDVPDAAPPPKQDDFIDLNAWLSERGVSEADRQKLKYVYMACEERTVGDQHETALLCHAWESVEQGRGGPGTVFRTRVRDTLQLVRDKHVIVVLDVAVAVTVTDKEEENQPDIVNFELALAPDGMSAELEDPGPPPPGAPYAPVKCDQALPALAARVKQPDATAWDRFDLSLSQKACDARGTYRWKQGRFVRLPKATARTTTSGP